MLTPLLLPLLVTVTSDMGLVHVSLKHNTSSVNEPGSPGRCPPASGVACSRGVFGRFLGLGFDVILSWSGRLDSMRWRQRTRCEGAPRRPRRWYRGIHPHQHRRHIRVHRVTVLRRNRGWGSPLCGSPLDRCAVRHEHRPSRLTSMIARVGPASRSGPRAAATGDRNRRRVLGWLAPILRVDRGHVEAPDCVGGASGLRRPRRVACSGSPPDPPFQVLGRGSRDSPHGRRSRLC